MNVVNRRLFSFWWGAFVLYDNETLRIKRLEQLASQSEDKIDWLRSEKKIEDRSKGDVFSKAFAVLQTTGFITQLEVTTLAFAVLNGILYLLGRNKPQDVCSVLVYFCHATTSDIAQLLYKRVPRMRAIDSGYEETSKYLPRGSQRKSPRRRLPATSAGSNIEIGVPGEERLN